MSEEIRTQILKAWRDRILGGDKPPASVFAFCRDIDVREREFYQHFASLDALDAAIWQGMVQQAVSAVAADADAAEYSARERYLAFLFTLGEVLREERSWVLARFPGVGRALACRKWDKAKATFHEFADGLPMGLPGGDLASRLAPEDWRGRLLYPHLLSVFEFFKTDESAGFESTDAYIEKSVRAAFALIEAPGLDAGLDLLRFLAGRKGWQS